MPVSEPTAVTTSVSNLTFRIRRKTYPSPLDWRDQVMYFLLVDRFDNGDPDPVAYDPASPTAPRNVSEGTKFQGGTLNGITRRLDYIRNLGATAIWLSPVFKNRQERDDTYHGYGIQNFLEIDPRFGTKKDLRDLVQKAHARNMLVILDIIINHTADNWAYPGDQPYYFSREASAPFDFGFWRQTDPAPGMQDGDAVWPVELQHPDCYKRRGQIRNWDNRGEAVDGDFLSLKELDINRPGVLDTLIKTYKYWIDYADVDGFRIDTVKHMESSATAIFCNAVREYARRIGKHNFFMFGEVVGDDRLIEEYLGRNARVDGTTERFPSLDACLDFPLYRDLEDVIKGFRSPTVLRERYERFHTRYADHGEAGKYFVTFVDNHDQMYRPYRRFMHGCRYPKQAALAIGYLLCAQGIPCIYYGTEQGFDGGGTHDSHVRECMFGGKWGAFGTTGVHFFNEQHEIYQLIRNVARARRLRPALRYGRQYFREISADGNFFGWPGTGNCTLAFSRVLDTQEVLIAMNLSSLPRHDTITVDFNLSPPGTILKDLMNESDTYTVEGSYGRAYVRVPLEGHQMAILSQSENTQ